MDHDTVMMCLVPEFSWPLDTQQHSLLLKNIEPTELFLIAYNKITINFEQSKCCCIKKCGCMMKHHYVTNSRYCQVQSSGFLNMI